MEKLWRKRTTNMVSVSRICGGGGEKKLTKTAAWADARAQRPLNVLCKDKKGGRALIRNFSVFPFPAGSGLTLYVHRFAPKRFNLLIFIGIDSKSVIESL
jgi:hypothetical protein